MINKTEAAGGNDMRPDNYLACKSRYKKSTYIVVLVYYTTPRENGKLRGVKIEHILLLGF